MTDHTTHTIEAFLGATAQRSPTPGGGAVAALTGSLSAALSRMVAAYSIGKTTAPEARVAIKDAAFKLRRDDELLRALMTQDAEAYAAMTTARKRAKSDPNQTGAYQESILAAIAVPMEIAGLASHTLGVLHGLQLVANRYLHSDLGAAAVIAHAAADAARFMVLVNLAEIESDDLRVRLADEINDTLRHCREHRLAVEAFVNAAFEQA